MYVAIDIGGTKTLVATLSPEGKILKQVKFATPATYPELLSALQVQVTAFGPEKYTAAAAGVPGTIDRSTGVVKSYGNLDWVNNPVRADLEKILGCPVTVENDGKVGGLAEALPLINEYKKVLYLAIGTGIGIAYTVNGIIDTNISDGGGHTFMIEYDGKVQPWEDFAGGSAIVRQYGKKASQITDQAIWKEISHKLGLGIIDLVASLTPDVIVLGGGVGAHFDRFGQLLADELKQYESEMMAIPPLRQAQHAEQAVIYGCYALIKQVEDGKVTS